MTAMAPLAVEATTTTAALATTPTDLVESVARATILMARVVSANPIPIVMARVALEVPQAGAGTRMDRPALTPLPALVV